MTPTSAIDSIPHMRCSVPILFCLILPAFSAEAVDYTKHVKPIFAAKCFSCHGAKQQQSGLRLDLRQNALRGGDYGPVIQQGKADESKLILRLVGSKAGLQMPPSGALEAEEIATIRAWIDQGADMPGRAEDAVKERPPTEPKLQAFIDAIHRHDLTAVKAGSKKFAKSMDAAGSTMLMHAANSGTIEMMRVLLAAGADPKAVNARNATALHWCVTDIAKMKLLLSKGADINAKTAEGRSPLYMAATLPAGAPLVQALLDAGADPNASTIAGLTPLFPAATHSFESVQILLAKGADPNAKSGTNATALMNAAFVSPRAVALLVANGADVKVSTKRGETAIANAANRGYLESVKLLLGKGADVNSTDYRGYTPLMHAAYCDGVSSELIRLLLSKGANVRATGEDETALTLAAKHGETEVTRIIRESF